MAVFNAGISVNLQEVSLRHKPKAMLDASAKGTVPVLCLGDSVIDESLEIMLWALQINDPDNWYCLYSETDRKNAFQLIHENDTEFKTWLDQYKYYERYPDNTQEYYRQQCDVFLQKLDSTLSDNVFLLGPNLSFTDIAIFPFIRQFSMVDQDWFDHCAFTNLRNWLNGLLGLPLFARVMAKNQQAVFP